MLLNSQFSKLWDWTCLFNEFHRNTLAVYFIKYGGCISKIFLSPYGLWNEMFLSVNVICYIITNSFYYERNKTYIHLVIEIILCYLCFRNAVLIAFLTNDWICGTICLFVILKGHRLRINKGENFDALCIEYYKFRFLNITVLRYLNIYISKIVNYFERCRVKPRESI